MFDNPSLVTRIGIGKVIGLVFGFIAAPYCLPEPSWLLRWGIFLWHTTVGAIIGGFGVFTYHPIVKLPFPG
jgi:hypothetical protein